MRRVCAGFASRLHFLGETPHETLYPIMREARLIVLPSLVDNLPNAMLGAMALGRPVLGTIGASFDEVIEDGVSGFLVPAGDASALSRRIIEVWRDADLEKVGERARDRMREFRPEIAIKTLTEYLRLAAAKPNDAGERAS
jgi:glycosyltransferase involved in cell wall biosynthesis